MTTRPATLPEIRAHYRAQGSEVRVRRGFIEFRPPGLGFWLDGRFPEEYFVDLDTGKVHLR